MDAKLVGPPRPGSELQNRVAVNSLDDPVASPGLPPSRGDARESLSVPRVPGDPLVDDSRLLSRTPFHQRQVALSDRPGTELAGKHFVGCGVLCHDDDPGGLLVQAMHDARTKVSRRKGGLHLRAVIDQRVGERMGGVAAARMDHHSLGLVHHHDVGVLIEDIQRDVLWDEIQGWSFRPADPHHVPELQPLAETSGLTVDQRLLDPAPRLASREEPEALGEEQIEPHPGQLRPVHRGLSGLGREHSGGSGGSRCRLPPGREIPRRRPATESPRSRTERRSRVARACRLG